MIVVTTPTGDIGRQVVERLLEAGAPLRVVVRDPSKLPAAVRERVEIVEGSHGDPSVVDRAFAGADAVFWLAPPNPTAPTLESVYVDFARPAVEAIRAHGVKRIVSVSALGHGTPRERTAGLVTASFEMDDLLAGTGAAFRALAMPSFMDNMLRQVDAIRTQGAFYGPLDGSAKHPTCATVDIASAAARLLLDDAWTGKGHVAVLGPEDLSPDDQAAIMTEVLGRPVRYMRISWDALEGQFRSRGASDAFVRGYLDMMTAKEEGLDDAEPRTPESSTPTTFQAWCEKVLKPAIEAAAP